MFIYALAQPIDFFDGLIPLPRWIAEDPASNTAWALHATLALADAAPQIGWTGDMRHLPSIGTLPLPDRADLFMVVKQDTRGTCFIISNNPVPWLLEYCTRHVHIRARRISAEEHTTLSDLRDAEPQPPLTTVPHHPDEPLF
jgi:hypothetical protein